ncbi:MAG: PilX N-terminal domain-containing pilus assembly protein [Polaromonas sp.]
MRGKLAQHGIVLILALVMLVVISLLTTLAVRNATSSEAVNSNVRQTQLASQAAETALRYCEAALTTFLAAETATFTFTSPPSSASFNIDATYIHDVAVSGTATSAIAANWDSTTAANRILVVPMSSVNRTGITTTFSRPPECMIDRLSRSTSSNYWKTFAITSRGFGPEVAAANAARDRPVGSEIWMQSSLEFN